MCRLDGDVSLSLSPPAVNPCCYFPCQNQGVCVRVGLRGYECDCTRTGYYGANCTSRESLSPGSATRGCQGSPVPTALTTLGGLAPQQGE